MVLIKINEVIGTSSKSFDAALKEAVKSICQNKKNVSGVKIVGWTADVKNGKIADYKVNVRYAYRWEEKFRK